MSPISHRHLSRELYEQAAESDAQAAARMRAAAASCPACGEALTPDPLSRLLAAQALPAGIGTAVNWQVALMHAIAPQAQPQPLRRPVAWRALLLVAALAALLVAVAVPAGAAGPDSVLYPVRGVEEEVVWSATQPTQRPRLEADLTSTYLWQARVSSNRRDSGAYQASMARAILWADRLKADLKQSSREDRAGITATVSASRSLLPELKSSATNQEQDQAGDVGTILNDVQVQAEEGDGDHGGGG